MSKLLNKITNVMPVIGLILPAIQAWSASGGDVGAFVDRLRAWYFGQQPDGSIKAEDLMRGWGPAIVGILVAAGVKLVPKAVRAITKAF